MTAKTHIHLKTEIKPSQHGLERYWRFAHARHKIHLMRRRGELLQLPRKFMEYSWTNVWRVLDYVSQDVVRRGLHAQSAFSSPGALSMMVLMLKVFNSPHTYDYLVSAGGAPSEDRFPRDDYVKAVLSERAPDPFWHKAYLMRSPGELTPGGAGVRHHKAIRWLDLMQALHKRRWWESMQQCTSMAEAVGLLQTVHGIGAFLALQFTLDLMYVGVLEFDERDHVTVGPGSARGLTTVFSQAPCSSLLYYMFDRQEEQQRDLGLEPLMLEGVRLLMPIDIQNVFCEVDKWHRMEEGYKGSAAPYQRRYKGGHGKLESPLYPKSWNLIAVDLG